MATTPGEKLSGPYCAHGLLVDVDIDGSFTLYHRQPTSEDAQHPFALELAEIAALLEFFETERGRQIQQLARESVRPQHASTPAAAAPDAAVEEAVHIADAFRTLPADVQERVSAAVAERARDVIGTPELAHLVERPERAALIGTAKVAAPARSAPTPLLEAFAAVTTALPVVEQRATTPYVREARTWADMYYAVLRHAKIEVDELKDIDAVWLEPQTPGTDGIHTLLSLRILAKHPEALVRWVTFVADLLEQGLLTDTPLRDEDMYGR